MQEELHWVQELACNGLVLPRCLNNFTAMKRLLAYLRHARMEKNYKQAYIAEKLNVDPSTISRWECGDTEMTLQQAANYAHVLGFSIKEVFAFLASEGEGTPSPIAEIHVEVFSPKAFDSIMETVANLGTDVSITSKQLRKWI